MGKFDGGVMLTFRSLVNQGYDVDDCKQEETSGVWGYLKNRLTGFSLHFSLFSCGQACYTFAKHPADVDEADCGLTVSVSSTGGKCAYSMKVVPSFIPGDSSPWAPAGEKCQIGRYVTTWHFLNSAWRQNLHRLLFRTAVCELHADCVYFFEWFKLFIILYYIMSRTFCSWKDKAKCLQLVSTPTDFYHWNSSLD